MTNATIGAAIKPLLVRLKAIRQCKEWLINQPSISFSTDFLYFVSEKEAFPILQKLMLDVDELILIDDYTLHAPVQPKTPEEKHELNKKVRAELNDYLASIQAGLSQLKDVDPSETSATIFELPENWTFKDATVQGFESALETSEAALLLYYLKAEGFIVPFKTTSLKKLGCIFGKSENTVKQSLGKVRNFYSERQSLLNKLAVLMDQIKKDMETAKRRVTVEKKEPLK